MGRNKNPNARIGVHSFGVDKENPIDAIDVFLHNRLQSHALYYQSHWILTILLEPLFPPALTNSLEHGAATPSNFCLVAWLALPELCSWKGFFLDVRSERQETGAGA